MRVALVMTAISVRKKSDAHSATTPAAPVCTIVFRTQNPAPAQKTIIRGEIPLRAAVMTRPPPAEAVLAGRASVFSPMFRFEAYTRSIRALPRFPVRLLRADHRKLVHALWALGTGAPAADSGRLSQGVLGPLKNKDAPCERGWAAHAVRAPRNGDREALLDLRQ